MEFPVIVKRMSIAALVALASWLLLVASHATVIRQPYLQVGLAPGLAPGEVIISGIQSWNSPGADDPGEFIELFNTTDRTISLEALEIVSRVDQGTGDGVVDIDWQLSAELTGASIAPRGFFLIAESGVDAENGVRDVVTDMDLATGEGGVNDRAISVELVIDGAHMDYVLYGWDGPPDPAGELPPGDLAFDPGTDSYPRVEVIRNTLGSNSFQEGLLRRESPEDLFAGHAVEGFYSDQGGVWTSPHDPENDAYQARNSTSSPILPPGGPADPLLVSPADGAEGISSSPELRVRVTHSNGLPMDVTFFGPAPGGPPAEDFTIIHFSDTQYYAQSYPDIFNEITQWIAEQQDDRNIVFAPLSGDCVQTASQTSQWDVADAALSRLEPPILPDYPDGIPWGLSPGNHDQTPTGNADAPGATDNYNAYFGESRFAGRSYYGGHFGTDNDNHYALFSAGGMDFIAIFMEYDTSPDPNVLQWADDLLSAFPNRRGIVISHYIMNAGFNGSFGTQGQAIFDALEDNPNLFLILAGHIHAEGMRTDVGTYGNTIYTLLADYQDLPNGGNGWIRILTFSPASNEILVETYSPVLGASGTDLVMGNDTTSVPFTLSYDMGGIGVFQELGTVTGVPSGSDASLGWPGLDPGAEHEWFVDVTDGAATRTSQVWSFTTACDADIQCDDGDACTGDETCGLGSGICQPGSPVVCDPGSVCDPDTGACQLEPVTVMFQQGVGAYGGTVDTFIQQDPASADNDNSSLEALGWDDDDPNGTGHDVYTLVRFDDVFGSGPGLVPVGVRITSATLGYTVGAASGGPNGDEGLLHEVLIPWAGSVSWNTFGGDPGASAVDEYDTTVVASLPADPTGTYVVDVTSSVQAWASDPASNNGWIILPTDTNGVDLRSSEYDGAPSERPKLTVTYLPGPPCLVDAECDDGNFCNGAETCDASLVCIAGAPPDCSDGISCTDDSCNEGFGSCEHIPVDAACDDGSFCNGTEVCDLALDCQFSSPPCEAGQICDEGADVCRDAACNDGLDNDGDGYIDWSGGLLEEPADPGCAGATDDSEKDENLPCDDGEDNDVDGTVDYPADIGCRDPSWTTENPECDDGVDNADNDDPPLADWDGAGLGDPDPHCARPWDKSESPSPGPCGLGAELALLLPPLLWLSRRRLGSRGNWTERRTGSGGLSMVRARTHERNLK